MDVTDSDTQSAPDGCCEKCSEDAVNKFIAIFVICIQIAAYIVMTVFLKASGDDEDEARSKNCYGPNCEIEVASCMDFTTGGLTSILLVGFLWADVVHTAFIARKNCQWFIASMIIIVELRMSIDIL